MASNAVASTWPRKTEPSLCCLTVTHLYVTTIRSTQKMGVDERIPVVGIFRVLFSAPAIEGGSGAARRCLRHSIGSSWPCQWNIDSGVCGIKK